MFKLYKKDGSEVLFETEEGMEKTLKAFPNKYIKKEIEIQSEKIEDEKDIDDLQIEKVEDEVFEANEFLEEE